MTGGPTGDVEALIVAAAAELEGVDRQDRDGATEWSTGAIVFAAVNRNGAEFRLSPPVAAAALRTGWCLPRPSSIDMRSTERRPGWRAPGVAPAPRVDQLSVGAASAGVDSIAY
jgi:hypothetical protein